MESEALLLVLLGLAGLVAGFTDSIAGGGGLLSVPALLAAGLPPSLALGTNKLQSTAGSLSASRIYLRSGLVSLREALPAIALTALGAATGTFCVTRISTRNLEHLLPWLLLAVFLFFLLRPRMGLKPGPERIPVRRLYPGMGLPLGFYDGFFGPGTGAFWTLGLVALGGRELKEATARTKLVNATSNLVSLLTFLAFGKIWFAGGLAMALGQYTGARLGAGLVVKKGSRFVRPVFLTVVGAMLVKLWFF